jgi:archaellum component FlaG (FlaF/FlaG flagellin family)
LLIITGYLLAGGMISLTETMVSAEKDMTALNVKTSGTSIRITGTSGNSTLSLTLENTGTERISDYDAMEVYVMAGDAMPELYFYNPSGGRGWLISGISPDSTYPGSWDPGEFLSITVMTDDGPYSWVQVTTPNGISASAYL